MLTTGHCVAMNYEAERKTEKLLKTDHKTTGDVAVFCTLSKKKILWNPKAVNDGWLVFFWLES